jgi:lipid-A-disaccharide synthase
VASGRKKILIVAGEASADLHGSKVVEALRRMAPEIRVLGLGGEHLRRAGVEILMDSSELAVVGITEVLGKIRGLYQAYRILKQVIQKREIALLILIDFPDFNLRLAQVANHSGIPVLYYISPQVWAWRPGRTKTIAQRVQRMAVIFPFEVPLYQAVGLETDFVGHPLMDVLEPYQTQGSLPYKRKEWEGNPLIALLPGSRQKEVKSVLPEMIRAAEILSRKKPGAQFLLALAPTVQPEDVRELLPPHGLKVTIVEGKTYQAIHSADLVIVTSGTATLETAILGKPMIIVYQVSPLSYWIGRAMIKVQWIGLVNIMAGRGLVPELLQEQARGERIAEEALKILENGSYRREMMEGLAEVSQKLGTPGAAERVAKIALEMTEGNKAISSQLSAFKIFGAAES